MPSEKGLNVSRSTGFPVVGSTNPNDDASFSLESSGSAANTVVKGVTTLEPAGAESVKPLTCKFVDVSIVSSVVIAITLVDESNRVMLYPPLASVISDASPSSNSPLLFSSAKTNAFSSGPLTTKPLSSIGLVSIE